MDDQLKDISSRFRRDERGRAVNAFFAFCGTLVIIALLMVMFSKPFNMLMDEAAAESSTEYSAQGITWTRQMFEWFPLIGTFIGIVGFLSAIVYVTKVGL